jgi:hypothetical protein
MFVGMSGWASLRSWSRKSTGCEQMFNIFKQVNNTLNFEYEFDRCEDLSIFYCCFLNPRPFETHDPELLKKLHRKHKPEANYYGRSNGISPQQAFVNMLMAIGYEYMKELGVSSPPAPLMYSLRSVTGYHGGNFYVSEKVNVSNTFIKYLKSYEEIYWTELNEKKRYEKLLEGALRRARTEISGIIAEMDNGVFSKSLRDVWIALYRFKFRCVPTEVEISKLYDIDFKDVVVNMRALVDAAWPR